MDKNNFRKIGSISKVNRKTGEATVFYQQKNTKPDHDPEVIFIEIDGGLVPFFVAEISTGNPESFRVVLQDYNTPEVAQRFVGCRVFLPDDQPVGQTTTLNIDYGEIVGYAVNDKTYGAIGPIADVFESPDQVLIQVFKATKEILIPLVEDYLIEVDTKAKTIYLDLPDGLLDIYLND